MCREDFFCSVISATEKRLNTEVTEAFVALCVQLLKTQRKRRSLFWLRPPGRVVALDPNFFARTQWHGRPARDHGRHSRATFWLRPRLAAFTLPTLSFGLILSAIFGLIWPDSATAVSAAARGRQQTRPAAAATNPRPPPALPKSCLEPTHINGNIAKVLDAVRDGPTAGAWNTLGALYAQRGDLACAIPSFKEALRLQPDSQEARYNLALGWIRSGRPAKAAGELRTLIQQNPQFAGAHLALGTVLEGAGKLEAAEGEYKAAIRADAHFYAAYVNLARLLDVERKYSAAISHLEQALALNPRRDVADQLQAALGRACAESGHPDKAQEVLGNLAAGKPKSAGAHAIMGTAQAQKRDAITAGKLNNQANEWLAEGKVQQAVGAYRKALQLNPNYAQAHYNLSLALDKLGDFGEEQQQLEEAANLDPKLGVAHDQLGLLALRGGKLDKAEQEFKGALLINPQDAEAQDNLGVVYSRQGDDAQAATMFQRSIEGDPKYAKA